MYLLSLLTFLESESGYNSLEFGTEFGTTKFGCCTRLLKPEVDLRQGQIDGMGRLSGTANFISLS